MGGGGGGGNGLLDMGLMVAAGIAAPELAAEIAPEMMAAGGASGAAVGAATGAGLSGLTAAAIGKNPLQAALMGGVGGAFTGFMPDDPNAIANAQAGANPDIAAKAAQAGTATVPLGTPIEGGTLGTLTPQQLSENVANGSMTMDQANAYGKAFTNTYNGITPAASTPNMFGQVTGPSNTQLYTSAGIDALGAMSKRPVGAYTPPNAIDTGGSLSKFHYDPNNYKPDVVVPPRPPYQANYTGMAAAGGGLMSLASGGYTHGGETYSLGSYSDGGRLLKGPGDGMSDDIPATIGGKQEARLADGEFVVPADVVSGLGNGSTDAGAKHLYKMMDKVRHARTGRKTQGKQIKGEKFVPA